MSIEDKLTEQGYEYHKGYGCHKMDAQSDAKELRKSGYYARVVENSTRVRGFHEFAVWIKEKNKKADENL